MPRHVLFSFVGNHDPLEVPDASADPGPVLSMLRERSFDHVVLLTTGSDYLERANVIRSVAQRTLVSAPTFTLIDVLVNSVVDYEELYQVMTAAVRRAETTFGDGAERFVLLDPGTPQMQTVWVLLAHAGVIQARLLQGIPARFGDGRYRWREVRLDPSRVPIEMHVREPRPTVHTEEQAPFTRRDVHTGTATDARPAPPQRVSADRWLMVADEIVGRSAALEAVLAQVGRAAAFDEVVLISGETGTGKELLARRLHATGPRRNGPFLPVNAATIDRESAESKLFGHAKGAYTGATQERPGAFRSAEGGTLFLDEIGELSLELQARLLRAIEMGEITPLGEDRPQRVNLRIVAATNRDLATCVRQGTFRADLLQRLRQIVIAVPPLRERVGDVAYLSHTFVAAWSERYGTPRRIDADAVQLFEDFRWPGNVRQLKNVVHRVCMNATAERIGAAAAAAELEREEREAGLYAGSPAEYRASERAAPIADPAAWDGESPVALTQILHETERSWYKAALRSTAGNKIDAARLLGLNAPAFRKALRERFSDLL